MIDKNETKEIVIKIIAATLKREQSSISEDATLQNLGADSLDIIEIIMNIEEQFLIHIDDEKAEKLKTIQDVIEYVQELREEKKTQ